MKLSFFRRISTSTGFEHLPSYGAKYCYRLKLGGSIFITNEKEVVGFTGWYDGELVTASKSGTGRFLGRLGNGVISEMVPLLHYDQSGLPYIELMRVWTTKAFNKILDKIAIKMETEDRVFYHIPFWREDATDIIEPVAPVREEDRLAEREFLPITYKGLNRNLKVGEYVMDNYGMPWSLLGFYHDGAVFLRVKNVQSGEVMDVLGSAFAHSFTTKSERAGDAPPLRPKRATLPAAPWRIRKAKKRLPG